MTSDPRYFNSVNTQNPHDYSTGYTTNIVNRIDAGDDNETFAVGGLVANFENSSLNETPHNNRHRRTFRTAKATGNHFPLSPQEAIRHYSNLLTDYEMLEIHSYASIYFLGSATVEKIGTLKRRTGADLHDIMGVSGTTRDKDKGVYNDGAIIFDLGFDDSRGDFYLTKHDHIGYRYEIISLLGKGSFGQVAKCYDHRRKIHVAVKVIRNKKRFEKQGEIEAKVLELLADADKEKGAHLVHLERHFYFRGHLCFVFELLGMNLYEYVKAGGFRGIHLGLVAEFAQQILVCLQLLSSLNIIHCDLKPENVLICDPSITRPSYLDANITSPASSRMPISPRIPTDFDPSLSQYEIKVIDFGSSCFEDRKLYTYVQSRFYRAPEVILGYPYDLAIDMWSFGCMLAELYTGYPLFPGENESEQLACIMEVNGLPNGSILEQGTRVKHFFDSTGSPRNLTNSKGKKRRPGSKTFSSIINCNDPSFTDILNQCLKWNPKERLTPQEALSHPFITGLKFKSSYESHKRYSTASNSFAKVSESPNSWNRSSATLTSNFTNNSPSIPSTTGHSRLSTVGGSKQENRKSASGFFGFASSKFYEKLPKPSLPPLLGPKRFSTKKDSPSKNESTSDENGSESRKLVCYY